MINTLVNQVIEKLCKTPALSYLQVEPFPDDANEFGDPVGGCRLFVGYQGSQPGGATLASSANQRNVILRMQLVTVDLSGANGAHDTIDLLYKTLSGFAPEIAYGPLQGNQDVFEGLEDGSTWTHNLSFSVICPPH